eukprot:CAMPEP_0172305334 /NCGR_PEP_ID=MMETSP1058-20130122/6649_1 /TAXON_ID=83371 /ORGANISM="Detonula confervacea, Strain CCMP 353" /LENGTH=109 /DNA_ID=CAMNT_0013016901 /DNA_START=202 /DNA_END=531 /DNA_ORIENTATION=+
MIMQKGLPSNHNRQSSLLSALDILATAATQHVAAVTLPNHCTYPDCGAPLSLVPSRCSVGDCEGHVHPKCLLFAAKSGDNIPRVSLMLIQTMVILGSDSDDEEEWSDSD